MTSQDIKQQIDNTLKASPANKPNVSVTNVEPKISDEEKQKQVLGVGSLVQQAQVASGAISQSQLERLVMPIDRSVGIAEPDYVGEPTKRVATARTLSTEGAKDYRQFEYDLDDSRGEAVEGAPEDGIILGNRGAGVASSGSVLGSTGELRDMDWSEGNPYFLKDKTPSIFKDVEPFPVSLPRYNIEAKSTTTSRAKLAYQLATAIQGEPEEYFLGYERIPESKEGFWSGLQKGISTGFTDLLTGVAKGGLFITSQTSQLAHKGWGHIIGADDEWFDWAEQEIENNTAEISEYIDKLNEQYARKVGGELTPDASMWASLGKSIPSTFGQIGLMMAGGPAGNWPMQIIMGGMQGQATWDAMEGLGLSPTDRNLRAIGSAVLSTILNRIGIFGLAQTQLAVTRRFATNTFKRMSSVVGQSLLGAAGEGLTELGDELLQDMFSLNIRDDNFSQRMDNYLTSLLAGAISGLVAVPMNVRAEKVQIARERILANKLGMSASQMEKSLKKFAEAAEKVGLMSKQQAVDLAFLMSLPEAQAQMNNAIKENIDAIYDKVNPEVLKQLLSLDQDTAKQTMQDFKDLDAKVMSNLPKQMDESTKVMVSRAMRGVAAILAIKGNKDIKVPMFKYRAGESEYDPATNTVYISANPSTTTSADSFVRNGELKKISPEQRSLLHEIGHVLDVQLGTNSDYKTFLPAYFNAIATVFGKKKAGLVQKAMPKTGERVGNVKKHADYLSDKNTTEWFAYSLGRLGRQVGEALGLTGEIADYVDVANVMAQQLLIPEMQNALTEYNNAVKALIKENDDTLIAMAKAAGEKGLAEAIERYVAGDENALSKDDVKNLYKILKSFVGSEGGKILSEAFQNVSVETFMERTNREFQRSIQDAPKRGKKIGDTQLEDFGGDQGYTPQDSVALQERPMAISGETNIEDLPAFNKLNETKPLPMQEKGSGSAKTPSNLERRMAAQDGMKTYDQTAKRVDEILSAPDYKPVSKFFTKVFGGYGSGDLNTYLWMISPDLQKEFDLVGGFAEAESLAMEDMSELWAATGLVSRYARNVFLNKLNQPSIKVEHLDDGMGGFEPKTLTPNQVLNIYLSAKTKSLPNTIAAFGGDEAAMRNAIDQLTPEQKQFGDNMQQFLRTKYYRNKVYTEEELMELTDTEMDELGLEEGFDVQEFLQRQDESTLYWPRLSMKYALVGDRRPNYDVARQENPDDPSSFEIPATELIGGYIYRQAAGKSGVYSKIRRIKDLFFYDPREETGNMDSKAEKVSDEVFDKSNKLRRKALKAFGGSDKALNNFKKLLNDHLNGIHTYEIGSSLLNKISRNYIAGQLSWKPIQFVKNSMNVFMFWGLAQDQGKYWADTMWAATHWKEAKQYMIDRVPWMKTRYENAEVDEQLRQNTAASDNLLMTWAQNKELPEGMQNAVANIVAISQAAKRVGYFSMLAGDAASNIIGGYGLLKQMIETYGEAEGVRRFTQALATKQSNTNRAVKSLMQREWNRDFRGQFITFMSEPVGKTKSLAVAVERARRGEISWKDAGMEIASLTMSMVLFSLISAGIIDLWDDNEENDKEVYKALGREGISMITGFHPLGGSMIAPLVSEVFMGGQQSINTTFTSGVFKALNALSDGDWGTVAADTAGATGMLIGAGALEQFVEGWLRAPSEDEAYAESGRRMIYGETKRRAEKRAGYKEPVENEDE